MLALARNELLDNRYRIVRWIGQGASAVVYEAVDTTLDRPVAIKILNSELIASPMLQARFTQEAEAAIHIDSPFVVAVHAVGTAADGHPYIVMELLDGEDLGHLLDRVGALEEEHAVELAIHALSGLAHAHARGVLHRDIKPDNLVIARSDSGDEVLKIVDLGISKVVTPHESLGLTRTNVVLGSPVYMSPEQARGAKHMDHRSDVFSVGVVLYECLTGKVPHDGDNFNDLMFKIALEDAPDPLKHKPSLDPELVKIVMKALTRDLDKRFQSASTFREALLEWGAGRGARVPPTPTSSSRMRVGGSQRWRLRGLEVTLDDDDDENNTSDNEPPDSTLKSTSASSTSTSTKARLRAKARTSKPPINSDATSTLPEAGQTSLMQTLAEVPGAAAASPHSVKPRKLIDSLEPPDLDRSNTRRKMGIVLVIAAALGIVLLLLMWGTRTSATQSSASSSASAAAPTPPPAPTTTEAPVVAASSTAAPSSSSSKRSRAIAGGTTPAKSMPRKPHAAPGASATPDGELVDDENDPPED